MGQKGLSFSNDTTRQWNTDKLEKPLPHVEAGPAPRAAHGLCPVGALPPSQLTSSRSALDERGTTTSTSSCLAPLGAIKAFPS